MELYSGMEHISEPPMAHENRARKFGHITLNVRDLKATERSYCGLLGFRVSDRKADKAMWVRCNPDHHGLALIENPQVTLRHFALEVFDWSALRQSRDFLLSRFRRRSGGRRDIGAPTLRSECRPRPLAGRSRGPGVPMSGFRLRSPLPGEAKDQGDALVTFRDRLRHHPLLPAAPLGLTAAHAAQG